MIESELFIQVKALLEMVMMVLSLVGGLYAGFKVIKKKIYRDIVLWIENINNAVKTVAEIKTEFKPNGGSSLKDSLNRIETQISFLDNARKIQITHLEMGFFETDMNGNIINVNKKFSEISGLSLEEARGMGWMSAVEHNDRERIKSEWGDAASDKRSFEISHTLGNWDVKTNGYPTLNGKCEILGWFCLVTELHENN